MTHAKFNFNQLMLTLIFGIRASKPPPPPLGPGERLKRPGLIGLNIFPTLQPFSTIRNVKQLKGCSNEDATVMGKISIQIGSMANEALF